MITAELGNLVIMGIFPHHSDIFTICFTGQLLNSCLSLINITFITINITSAIAIIITSILSLFRYYSDGKHIYFMQILS